MTKVTKGPQHWLCPMPALLVGAMVEGKPTFMTVAWGGIANGEPPMVSLAIRPARHTLVGIRAAGEFSVNVPSTAQVTEVDFCGIKSGATIDKVEYSGLKVFHGQLTSAPLVEQCPINLECLVDRIIELESHCLVLGKIVETHVSKECLTDEGTLDFRKTDPIVFLDNPTRKYCCLGKEVADAFSVGLSL